MTKLQLDMFGAPVAVPAPALSAPVLPDEVPIGLEGAARWSEDDIDDLRRLLLEDSLVRFASGSDHKHRDGLDAELDWIFGEQSEGPFGFDACCVALRCDPDAIRAFLAGHLARDPRKLARVGLDLCGVGLP